MLLVESSLDMLCVGASPKDDISSMKQLVCWSALFLGICGVALDLASRDGVEAAEVNQHSYFDTLVRRSDVWKSYSLRTAAQLSPDSQGGLIAAPDQEWASYSPDTDTDRNRQDAAKVVIPAFNATTVLTRAVGASDTLLTLESAYKPQYPVGRVIKVDREVMRVASWQSDTTISVERGAFSTAAASHAAGAVLMHATNSLKNQIRMPLGTSDGHSYFFTWDGYWTDSYVGAGKFNHKAFQFSNGGQDGNAIWFEPDVTYGDTNQRCYQQGVHFAAFHARSYNQLGGVANWLLTDGNKLGPSVTAQSPLNQSAEFCMKPNQWVRFFMHFRQRANDYDYVDFWLADEEQEPIQVLANIPVSLRPTGRNPHSIQKFWVELNTSTDDFFRIDNRDLVAYVRNFVALQDPADVRPLLVRPVPGAQAVSGPAAPRNVRIISGS